MDVIILTGAELRAKPSLQQNVFKLRHRVFVEKLGWEAIRRADGLEIDEFDTDDAIHFIILDSGNVPVAYSRLLATTRPHLLANVYPNLLNNGNLPPRSEKIMEWTRITPVPGPTTQNNKEHDVAGMGFAVTPAGRRLIVAVIEWALANSIDTLSAQCDPALALVVEALGGSAQPLAKPSLTSENQWVVPILVHLQPTTPVTMRSRFGMPKSFHSYPRKESARL